MKNYFDEICNKLNKEIAIEHISIVDNSFKHKGHKFFSPEKFHLRLKIKSLYLNLLFFFLFFSNHPKNIFYFQDILLDRMG